MELKRSATLSRKKVKEEVLNLMEKAEQTKTTSYQDAITLLYEAAQYIPQLAIDRDEKKSDRKITQKGTQEIIYMSKKGQLFYDLKEYEKAQECYAFIKQKLPNNTEVHRALGDCLRKLKKYPEAFAMYDRGLVVYEKDDIAAPNVKAALLNCRGLNYMEQGNYAEAKTDFEAAVKMTTKNPNPLYLCNKGYVLYALDDKDEALEAFKQANEVAQTKDFKGLTEENVAYIKKTLKEFLEGLEELKTVDLDKQDVGIEARERNYIKANLDALTGSEEAEQGDTTAIEEANEEQGEEEKRKAFSLRMAAKIATLKKVKLTIQEIQKDTKLFEYYDGFLFGLAQSYTTAVVINSGQLSIDVDAGTELQVLTSALKLVPIVGSQLSDSIHSVVTFAKSAQVTKASANICKLATNQTMFMEIVQDALLSLIQSEHKRIKSLNDDDINKTILPKWASRYQNVVDKITQLKGNVDEVLYGERNETPLQKLGYQTASTLISENVASGTIYKNEVAVRIPKEERTKRVAEIAKDLFDKSLGLNKQPQQLQLQPQSQSQPQQPQLQSQQSQSQAQVQQPRYTEVEDGTESKPSCESCKGCSIF